MHEVHAIRAKRREKRERKSESNEDRENEKIGSGPTETQLRAFREVRRRRSTSDVSVVHARSDESERE